MYTSKESPFRTYWQSFVAPNGSEFCIFAPIFLKCLNNRKFQWASVILRDLSPPKILCYYRKSHLETSQSSASQNCNQLIALRGTII